MELDTREIASLIVVGAYAALILCLGLRKNRGAIVTSFVQVLKAMVAWRILVVSGAYLVYATAVVAVAYFIGVWSWDLLKETIVAVLFVAFPVMANFHRFADGRSLLRRALLETLGVAAVLVFYINLAPMPLWAELVVQFVGSFVAILAAFARAQGGNRGLVIILNVILVAIGLAVAIYTTTWVVGQFSSIDWLEQLRIFLVGIWLPFALSLFIYVTAFVAAVETIVKILPFHNNRTAPPRRVRLALVLGLHGSLRYARRFQGQWLGALAIQVSFRGARSVMRDFRRTVRARVEEAKARDRRLRQSIGAVGRGPEGLWLDRREFDGTKRMLEMVFFHQLGQYKSHGAQFQTDPSLVSPVVPPEDLPAGAGFSLRVTADRQSWMAWRETPGGYFFGVGGTSNTDQWWRYDGSEMPAQLPEIGATGWHDVWSGGSSDEWAFSDRPVSVS